MRTCQALPHLMPASLLLGVGRATGAQGQGELTGGRRHQDLGWDQGQGRPAICPPSLGFLHVTGSPPGLEEAVAAGRAGGQKGGWCVGVRCWMGRVGVPTAPISGPSHL